MPSSLVFTALVVSWLAVLVPVVARRRQLVPRPAEADLCSRVLSRSGRAPAMKEVVVSQKLSQGRGRSAVGGTVLVEDPANPDADDEMDDRDLDDRDLDDDRYADDRDLDDRDPDHAEPKPYRVGRGGFDADAAREAADMRYATRRRIAVGLIAAVVVSGLAALVLTSAAWWMFGVTVLGLAGYLVFLRRQTRLEEELRERRVARLHGHRREIESRRRAERPVEDDGGDGYDRDDGDDGYDGDDRFLDERPDEEDRVGGGEQSDDRVAAPSVRVSGPRWAAPRTPAPAVPAGMDLVGDSEDDPDFHDLDGDRVPAYRRAAGA